MSTRFCSWAMLTSSSASLEWAVSGFSMRTCFAGQQRGARQRKVAGDRGGNDNRVGVGCQ